MNDYIRFLGLLLCVPLLPMLGCNSPASNMPHHDIASLLPAKSLDVDYPREVDGVGWVHEPVSEGNLCVHDWAWGWADAYDAEVFDVYTSRNFYYVVLRRDDLWLFAFETRFARPMRRIGDTEYLISMSYEFLRPDDDVMNNLRPAGARELIDPQLDGVVRFSDRLPDDINNDRMDWERDRYTTYMPGDESQFWGHMPPIEVHDDELTGEPLMVVWYLSYGPNEVLERQYQVDSVYWLHPD